MLELFIRVQLRAIKVYLILREAITVVLVVVVLFYKFSKGMVKKNSGIFH